MKAYILYIDKPESIEMSQRCAESCKKYEVEYELVKGIKGKTYEQIKQETNMMVGRSEKDHIYWKEYNAALGHIEIWKKIIASGEPGIVLEHDAVVKFSLNNLEVKDDTILHLGPKVYDVDDYQFAIMEVNRYVPVRRWEGAHAYVLSPKLAQYLIDKMVKENRLMPTEGVISVRNRYGIKMETLDPPRVVCVQPKDGVSFTDAPSEKNFKYFKGFLAGVKGSAKLMPENDYVFTEDWFTGNIQYWKQIFEKTGKKPEDKLTILEIGAYEGRATTWLADNMLEHEESVVMTCDTFMGSLEHTDQQRKNLFNRFNHNLQVCKYPEKVMTFTESSLSLMPRLILGGLKYDIIYIDGSHETQDVLADGYHAWNLLADDGVVIFDDYQWRYQNENGDFIQPVKIALDYLERCLVDMHFIHDGWQRAYIKKQAS